MIKNCSKCGKEFEANTNRQRLCPACKEKHRKEHINYTVRYRKEKRHAVLLDNDDYKVIKAIAEISNMSIRETIHQIILQKVLTD